MFEKIDFESMESNIPLMSVLPLISKTKHSYIVYHCYIGPNETIFGYLTCLSRVVRKKCDYEDGAH